MNSSVGSSSVVLWLLSALIALLGARAYVEYLRRLSHDSPLKLWREVVLAATALSCGLWSAVVIDVMALGLVFEIGYHPVKAFGPLLVVLVLVALLLVWASLRTRWPSQLAAGALATLAVLVLQVSVVWSIGAEPGLFWRVEPLVFAVLLLFVGLGVSGRMVLAVRRGSRNDRSSRRLLAALVLGACAVAAQELVLSASGLDRQVVSAHARFLPEMAIALVAGAAIPVGLVLLLLDQRSQRRTRASARARKRDRHAGTRTESMLADSTMVGGSDPDTPAAR